MNTMPEHEELPASPRRLTSNYQTTSMSWPLQKMLESAEFGELAQRMVDAETDEEASYWSNEVIKGFYGTQ
jgi:hypothetical protein